MVRRPKRRFLEEYEQKRRSAVIAWEVYNKELRLLFNSKGNITLKSDG
ncbi:hypothetical protein PRIO_5751 [Paenibacillus riograndensis SBR5]|uniref:Uncharacterized protein n=1 Tax=Paenibacillus riograndensis SBR5 TaxID=1073571 RepID=A0A0E3WJ43_9BACL|nr:hypothetical protein PRIO_5751 [Paenibacillus riograndensis SBR5]